MTSVNSVLDYLTARLDPVPGSAVVPHGGLHTNHIEEVHTRTDLLVRNHSALRKQLTKSQEQSGIAAYSMAFSSITAWKCCLICYSSILFGAQVSGKWPKDGAASP